MRKALRIVFIVLAAGVITIAAALCFATIRRAARETESPIAAAPATGRFVQAADTSIFLQEAGPTDGPIVILVHGTGTWSEIWRQTMTILAEKGFHVVAIDMPPFGFSGKPIGSGAYQTRTQASRLIALLDDLHASHAIFVAHSAGARPALEAALEAPERVSQLILVDPALGFAPDEAGEAHFNQNAPSWLVRAFFAFKPLRDAVLATYGTNPASIKPLFTSFVSRKEAVTPERVALIQRPLVVQGTTAAYGDWLQNLTVAPDDSLAADFDNFKKLPMPVGIIWGGADTVTPPWQGRKLQELIPGAKLLTIENSGHVPYIEDPDRFNSDLLSLLIPSR